MHHLYRVTAAEAASTQLGYSIGPLITNGARTHEQCRVTGELSPARAGLGRSGALAGPLSSDCEQEHKHLGQRAQRRYLMSNRGGSWVRPRDKSSQRASTPYAGGGGPSRSSPSARAMSRPRV